MVVTRISIGAATTPRFVNVAALTLRPTSCYCLFTVCHECSSALEFEVGPMINIRKLHSAADHKINFM